MNVRFPVYYELYHAAEIFVFEVEGKKEFEITPAISKETFLTMAKARKAIDAYNQAIRQGPKKEKPKIAGPAPVLDEKETEKEPEE